MRVKSLVRRLGFLFIFVCSSLARAGVPTWGYDFGSVTNENLESTLRSAMSGDEVAMLHLGEAYRSGLLTGGFNFEEAKRWYELAAAKGNAQAQLQLYHILSKGLGASVDYESADKYLKASADQGFFEAQYYQAQKLLYREPTEETRVEGVRLLLLASAKPSGFLARRGLSIFSQEYLGKLPPVEIDNLCDLIARDVVMVSGVTGAHVALANCIDTGYVPQKNTKADVTKTELIEEAARRGQVFFKIPADVSENTKGLVLASQREIERLAIAGHMHSLMVIADCYIFSVADDSHATCEGQEDGFRWNMLAAEKIGNVFFPQWLAYRYQNGVGIPTDVKKAELITVDLALKGSPSDMAWVAEKILDGYSSFGSLDFAVSMAQGAYDIDSRTAATLARIFLEGASAYGFDHERGVELLYEAFDWGDLAAGFQIATILETGLVVERDLEEALRIYREIGSADYWFATYQDPTLDDKARVAAARLTAFAEENRDEARGNSLLGLNTGKYRALLIGNSEYEYLPKLTAPARDVTELSSLLSKYYGFEVEILLNATRPEILGALSRYRKELAPQDNFLLYFAGHGTYDQNLEMGFWQPVEAEPDADYSWIDTTRVSRTLSGFSSRNVLVIADSCFSAAVLRGSPLPGANASTDLQSLVDRKTRLAFTSGGLEPVLDAGSSGGSSVFANEIINVLRGTESPITATELFNLVRGPVTNKSSEMGVSQIPEFSPLYRAGHDGGDFVFIPAPKARVGTRY